MTETNERRDADEMTLGLKSFADEIEREIAEAVTAAVAPLRDQIAELEERLLCIEMSHNMAPANYEQPEPDDDDEKTSLS